MKTRTVIRSPAGASDTAILATGLLEFTICWAITFGIVVRRLAIAATLKKPDLRAMGPLLSGQRLAALGP